jgi:hypothetical protein
MAAGVDALGIGLERGATISNGSLGASADPVFYFKGGSGEAPNKKST